MKELTLIARPQPTSLATEKSLLLEASSPKCAFPTAGLTNGLHIELDAVAVAPCETAMGLAAHVAAPRLCTAP